MPGVTVNIPKLHDFYIQELINMKEEDSRSAFIRNALDYFIPKELELHTILTNKKRGEKVLVPQ